MNKIIRTVFVLCFGSSLMVSCTPPPQSGTPFSYQVDPTLKPSPETVTVLGPNDQPQPLAAVMDDKGLTSTFIANQVLISPKSQGELDAFLAKYGGKVVGSDAVPACRRRSTQRRWS